VLTRAALVATLAGMLIATLPPDRIVEVDGAQIRVRCDGDRAAGTPVVVLEAGAGNGAETWSRVQPEIAEFARVCGYDRPTLVRNGATRPPTPTPAAVVATLDAVLTKGDEPPPYVLVGHSLGGMIVRLYAMKFPEKVKGMVLVDSSHEDQQRRFAEADPSQANVEPSALRTEAFDLPAMSAALRTAAWHSTMPLVVLSRTTQSTPMAAIWLDLQRELATRSTHASHIVAEHSGHYIQNDEPSLVIDAVRRVVNSAR